MRFSLKSFRTDSYLPVEDGSLPRQAYVVLR